MTTYSNIENQVKELITGIIEPITNGIEVSYTADQINEGIPQQNLLLLKEKGFDVKIIGRKWKKVIIALVVAHKQNGKVWYS